MRAPLRSALALLALLAGPQVSRADLGVLVADGVAGAYRISVLVSPVPLRAGQSQWSVLVQDASGGIVEDAEVELSFSRQAEGAHRTRHPARAGSHPFYLSSEAELAADASWRVEVSVRGPQGREALIFDVGVAPGFGPWPRYWPALLAPLAGIGLFALHQFLALRRRRARA